MQKLCFKCEKQLLGNMSDIEDGYEDFVTDGYINKKYYHLKLFICNNCIEKYAGNITYLEEDAHTIFKTDLASQIQTRRNNFKEQK